MLPIQILLVLTSCFSVAAAILENVGEADLDAVRIRLEDEKAKRLLLENDVEVLMLKVEELKRNFFQISESNKVSNGKDEVETVRQQVQRLTNMVLSLQNQVDDLQSQLKRETRAISPEYGFMAMLSNNVGGLHLNQRIVFDKVIINIGDAYNSHNGLFTCVVPGTYMFAFSIMAGITKYVEAALTINGNRTINAISDYRGFNIWDMGTSFALLSLREGDVASVVIQWPDRVDNTLHANGYTSFSGYLLWQAD